MTPEERRSEWHCTFIANLVSWIIRFDLFLTGTHLVSNFAVSLKTWTSSTPFVSPMIQNSSTPLLLIGCNNDLGFPLCFGITYLWSPTLSSAGTRISCEERKESPYLLVCNFLLFIIIHKLNKTELCTQMDYIAPLLGLGYAPVTFGSLIAWARTDRPSTWFTSAQRRLRRSYLHMQRKETYRSC